MTLDMAEYMITCDLPMQQDAEFMSMIPDQQAAVSRLFKGGILTSYTLSLDRLKLWMTMLADSEEQVMVHLAEMPMMPYFKVDIHPLMFHNAARVVLPAVSLN